MASPAQLMQTVSAVTGVPLPTIVDIDRRLVKAGLRTKGGRGFNVAQITVLDASRLLTAILGSAQANMAAEAVARYAQTRIDKTRSSNDLFNPTYLEDLAALPARHSFVDAIATLIVSTASGSLNRLATEASKNRLLHIDVFAFTRATWGRIRISGLPDDLTASVEYRPTVAAKARRTAAAASGDLEQSRRITARTILTIADLLNEETPDD